MAYGPILGEAKSRSMEDHKLIRNVIGAMEKQLATDLSAAGYQVMNEVRCSWELDRQRYRRVRSAFAADFPGL